MRVGVNTAEELSDNLKVSIRDVDDEKLMNVINRVNAVFESEVNVVDEIRNHSVVEDEMAKNSSYFGPEVIKHLTQNSSLLGSLSAEELLNVSSLCYSMRLYHM